MTCIVGIAQDGAVVLAGDSAGSSAGNEEVYTFNNSKVLRLGAYGIGFTTSYRMGQILRYEAYLPEPPEADLERFMATTFVDALQSSFERGGFRRGLGEHGSILVGVQGCLFAVGTEYQVLSGATPYLAVGSARRTAYGALFALDSTTKEPRERAEIALRAAQRFNSGVFPPFNFVEL